MDVTSLYANIPQEEGITKVCEAFDKYHNNSLPIPFHYLIQILGLKLKENRSSSTEKSISKFTEQPWERKWRLLSPISSCMAEIETKMLNKSRIKPKVWKRYIDDVFSLWNVNKQEIDLLIEQANTFHPTIKFTAEISEKEITFLDTIVYKGERFLKEAIIDVKTRYKPTEIF